MILKNKNIETDSSFFIFNYSMERGQSVVKQEKTLFGSHSYFITRKATSFGTKKESKNGIEKGEPFPFSAFFYPHVI